MRTLRSFPLSYAVLMMDLSFKVTNLVQMRLSFVAPVIYVMLLERLERFEFTYVHENAYLSFGMAKPALEPRWKSVYYPLSSEVWIVVTGHVVFFPFLLWQVKVFYNTCLLYE